MSTALVNDAPTTRTYQFVVEERIGSPDGIEKRMLVVNGQFPAPLIKGNKGDTFKLNVFDALTDNELDTVTSIVCSRFPLCSLRRCR